MSEAGAAAHPGAATSDPLTWLGSVLWPSDHVWTGTGTPPARSRLLATYAVLPGARRPRVLVPVGTPRAAAASLHQFNQGMTTRARLRKTVGGLAFRVGAGARIAGGSFRVAADEGAEREDLGIEALLRSVLDLPDAVCAITVGVVRPNVKPVVCVVRPAGDVVAFAKVAWNEATAAFVEREQAALRSWANRPPRTFAVPSPIGTFESGGFPVGVASPAPQPVVRRGPVSVPLPVVREIALRGGTYTAPLAGSEGWAALRDRVARAAASGPLGARSADVLASIERRWGGLEIPFGSWHGDFAPWNTIWHRGRWTVWDWERSGDGAPVGSDAVHWQIQVASHGVGRDLPRAVEAARPSIDRALSRLEAGAPEAVLAWYFTERLARYEEARVVGTLDRADPRPGGCLRVLEGLV